MIIKPDSMHWFSQRRRTGRRHLKTPPSSHEVDPSAAAAGCFQQAHTIRMHPGVSAALSTFFVRGDPDLWPLTFKLRQDFCTMHLTTKFHNPTLNRSEVTVRTNKQTDKQMPNIHLASLRYATPVRIVLLLRMSADCTLCRYIFYSK